MLGFLSEDDHLDAAQDAADDRFVQVTVACGACGMLYGQGHHPATRFEPAYIEQSECPNCGSGEIEEKR